MWVFHLVLPAIKNSPFHLSIQLGDKFIDLVCPFAPQKEIECETLADQYADDLIEAVTYEFLWPDDFCAAIGLCK